MTDKALAEQEYEIKFDAKLGTLLYQMDDSATLEPSFPIPHDWTRYMALDPHPRVPHAFLWAAVDPWGDAYIYRELWMSKIYGKPGNVPEDDYRFRIKEYIETVQWLESAANKDNGGKKEKIHLRVIDYAARAFRDTTDSEDQRNLQERYEDWSRQPIYGQPPMSYPLSFADCIKDREAGAEVVNDWLKPRQVETSNGWKYKSKLHIFRDACPELLLQLRTNRFGTLSPAMAEKMDPQSKALQKRNHLTDCLKYLCMEGLRFVPPVGPPSTWKPITKGVAY
jgi:hypothetical protein